MTWQKKAEHSAHLAKAMLTHLTTKDIGTAYAYVAASGKVKAVLEME
jgi:hypothetical protein